MKILIKKYLVNIYILLVTIQKCKNIEYLNDQETINYLTKNRLSFIRWGDGETNILFKKDIYFQKYDENLHNDLIDILKYAYKGKYLLGLPINYIDKCSLRYLKNKKILVWYKTRYIIKKYMKNIKVGSSFIFRPLSDIKNEVIEKLWFGKIVILVTSDYNNYKYFKDKYKNYIEYIKIDCENAYDKIEKIIKNIESIGTKYKKEEIIILISAGPTAKVIAYYFANKKYQTIDIGQYFKWKYLNINNLKGI